jgi:hypothetical protein
MSRVCLNIFDASPILKIAGEPRKFFRDESFDKKSAIKFTYSNVDFQNFFQRAPRTPPLEGEGRRGRGERNGKGKGREGVEKLREGKGRGR